MRFTAFIQNKTIVPKNLPITRMSLEKFEGKEVWVDVDTKKKRRSYKQNKYYWTCIEILAEYTGNSAEEMHKIMKGLHGIRKEVKIGTKSYMIPKSTSEYTTGEMVEYMMHLSVEAGLLGVILPNPRDYEWGFGKENIRE